MGATLERGLSTGVPSARARRFVRDESARGGAWFVRASGCAAGDVGWFVAGFVARFVPDMPKKIPGCSRTIRASLRPWSSWANRAP